MCGLISGAHVGRMFIVAFIFLVIFGALGFGIYFLYTKFLVDSSQSMADLSTVSVESAPKKGQAVDIVIRDEELPADSNASQYYVGSNRFMLNSGDVGKGFSEPHSRQSPKPSVGVSAESIKNENKAAMNNASELADGGGTMTPGESSGDKQFVPVRNLETLYNASGKEAVTKGDIAAQASQPEQTESSGQTEQAAQANQSSQGDAQAASQSDGNESFSAEDEQLDTLPDLDNVGIFDEGSSGSTSYYAEDNINNDSDFATGGVRNKKEPPDVKDAELMAKAISTILTNEE